MFTLLLLLRFPIALHPLQDGLHLQHTPCRSADTRSNHNAYFAFAGRKRTGLQILSMMQVVSIDSTMVITMQTSAAEKNS